MRIGVVVPVREPAPFLEAALDSARGQDPPPDKLAVVRDDDGRGPAATRDEALAQLADCDWIALLDADDAWEPGKLAAQSAAIERHPRAVVCFGRATAVDEDGAPTGEELPELEPGLHSAAALSPRLYESNPIPASSALIRRDALVEAGGFAGPAALASDWDLWLRLAGRGGDFVCEPSARIRYRRHAAGVTADISALAESRLAVHDAHETLVDEDTRQRVRADDLVLLARGRIRERRWEDAARAFREADKCEPLGRRELMLRRLVRVPGLRQALGRRRPYR